MADPFEIFTKYEPEIPDPDLQVLKVENPEDIVVMCILTVPSNIRFITANLLAPIVVNVENRIGKQVVLVNSPYQTKHRVFPEEES